MTLSAAFLAMVAAVAIRRSTEDNYVSPVSVFGVAMFFYVIGIPLETQWTKDPVLRLHSDISISQEVLLGAVTSALVAYAAFALSYSAGVDKTPHAARTFDESSSARALGSVRTIFLLASATVVFFYFDELLATRDYSAVYTTRYTSPGFSFGMATTQLLLGMLGFIHARRGDRGRAVLAVTGLAAWGIYSNQKAPLVTAALILVGFILHSGVKVNRRWLVGGIAATPAVVAIAALSFSINRGGGSVAGFFSQAQRSYLTTIEPAGPFASIIAELQEPGSTAPEVAPVQSILQGFVGWLPRAVWPSRPLDLAEEFGRRIIPNWQPGQGYGYSPVAEGLHQGGLLGLICYFAFLGLFIAGTRNLFLHLSPQTPENGPILEAFYYIGVMSIFFTFFRTSFQGLVITLIQSASILVPILLLGKIDAMVQNTRKHGNRKDLSARATP